MPYTDCIIRRGGGLLRFSAITASVVPRAASALLVLLLASACLQASAAVRDYYFQRTDGSEGLAQNTVTALVQDGDGFIWVGTQGGLHRYDGQRYTLYRQDPRDPGSLPDSFITALARDDEHGLWVGTYSQYLARMDLRDGHIRRYPVDAGDGGHSRRVFALLAETGVVWVGTEHGLERLDPASGKRSRVLALPAARLTDQPQALLRGPRGTLWYATAVGLFRIDAGSAAARIGLELPLRTLLRDRSGRIWAGGIDALYLLQDRSKLLQVWPRSGTADAGDVRALVEAPDGQLWFSAVPYGLRRFDPRSGATTALRQNPLLPGTLPENAINALLVDQAGLLWVGGQYHGVAVADAHGARFRYLVDLAQHGSDRPALDSSIRAIYQSRDRRLWLGTDDGRLLRYDASSGFRDFSALLPDSSSARSGQRVMAFADAGDGFPWVATTIGLFRLDPGMPAMQPVPIPGIPAPNLRSLAIGRDGTLWLGSNEAGVIAFRPGAGSHGAGTVRRIPFLGGDPRGLAHPQVHAVLVADDGKVWIGTGHGLDRFDPRTGRLRHFQRQPAGDQSLAGDIVRALWQDRDGSLWVGSHGGLNRIRVDRNDNVRFSQPLLAVLDGEPLPVVFSLAGDLSGAVWMGSNRGLLRYTPEGRGPRAGTLRNFGMADGLQDLEFNGGAVATLDGGQLAFGGVGGLNVFDPALVKDSTLQPPLRLLSVQVGAQAADTTQPAWQKQQLELPETADILRLQIGALDYLGNAGIRYRYRIDGLDQDWIDNGTRSQITYTLLPAGHYVFRAQSTNHDGIWSSHELRLPIVVTPPPWRHPLALAAYGLLAALALWLLWRQWHRRRALERGYFERIRDREERLKLALWASGEQFWDYDLARGELQRMRVKDDVRSASDIAVETEVESNHRIHRNDLPQVRDRLRQHLRGETPLFLSEHRIPGDDGQWIWIRARGRAVERDADGRVLRLAGTARNITHSRHAERERRIASEVLRSMNEAVSVLDRNFDFISINPAFSRMTGYGEVEVIGRNASILDSAQHEPAYYREIREHLQRSGRWSGEMWQQRKDGEEFLCAYECSSVLDGSGQHMLFVVVLSDITDQKRAEQELRYLANFDTLTNLPNRTLLAERLSRAIVRARRQDDRIAVLFLDLDRFKDINDSLGHAAGDRILRAAAVRLQDTVGVQHTVARLGGDEFTVVLENLEAPEQADKVAREIITAFEAPLLLDDRQEISISPSIGISLYPDHAQVPTELLKQADTAMYQAKAAGRRTYMRYTEAMDVAIRRRATVSGALRKVLDRGELRLVYQPRLALSRSKIVGVEALLRWHSQEHGEIPPTQFIPLAEESGLILEIGEWVLREACLTLARWHQHGLAGVGVSVNVSALQLLRGDLPDVVERVLAESGLPAKCLELELTESVIMANAQQTADKLQAFRDLGVTLAIDDFGTGYSSLAYLKRLPINTLKIDKEFVDDLSHGSEDAAITTTIIAMARALGINVVAEGVETEAQLQFLRAHRCDEIQGYWLSPPLEAQRCLAFIRNWLPAARGAPQPGATPWVPTP
ncbi:EAL domain-containing protein [Luteimonas sp. 50]|uniref:EAL domain-containing protein n=1 Tax=Cognatiluteimonas sedimenti TaxID=2927791 RepID=A0ABT0A3K0_9GAMM|nr:EAL domain-containing protein [Lysobacter sedimenti]MCJ0825564.1 EAL domain-containing protein [Lysobacter sedimenti]